MIKSHDVSLFIATPTYDTMVTSSYAQSLAETVSLLRGAGVKVAPSFIMGSSLLCKTRNILIKQFMDSGCSHMLCVDSDLGWPAEAVMAMLQVDKDLVAGLYPGRGMGGKFVYRPEVNEDDSIITQGHLLKMEYVPAGFMLLKRCVIERLMEKFPERHAKPKHPDFKNEDFWVFFNTELYEEEFWGEDYIFSRLVRESGTDIWVDPNITFNHAGTVGCVLSTLLDDTTGQLVQPSIKQEAKVTKMPSNEKVQELLSLVKNQNQMSSEIEFDLKRKLS